MFSESLCVRWDRLAVRGGTVTQDQSTWLGLRLPRTFGCLVIERVAATAC